MTLARTTHLTCRCVLVATVVFCGRPCRVDSLVQGWYSESMAVDMYGVADIRRSTWIKVRTAGQLVTLEEPWGECVVVMCVRAECSSCDGYAV